MSPVPPATSSSRMPGPRRQPVDQRRPSRAGGRRGSSRRSSGRSGRRPRRRPRARARPSRPRGRSRSRNAWWLAARWVGSGAIRAVFRSLPPLLIRQVGRSATARGRDLPELPEVETVRRGLEPVLAGRAIVARRGPPPRPALAVPAAPGRAADRRAGHGAPPALEVPARRPRRRRDADPAPRHVRPAARLGRAARQLPPPAPGAGEARPRRPRRRGRRAGHLQRRPPLRRDGPLADARSSRRTGCSPGLGPEPLGNAFDGAYLAERLAGRRTSIKAVLGDQRVVAGLGNIYVCEALWRAARLAPPPRRAT